MSNIRMKLCADCAPQCLHSVMLYLLFQRKFIREEPSEAGVQREMFTNFRRWVEVKYPSGILEDTWDEILEEDETMV